MPLRLVHHSATRYQYRGYRPPENRRCTYAWLKNIYLFSSVIYIFLFQNLCVVIIIFFYRTIKCIYIFLYFDHYNYFSSISEYTLVHDRDDVIISQFVLEERIFDVSLQLAFIAVTGHLSAISISSYLAALSDQNNNRKNCVLRI